jgi:hypothetical protein
MKFQLPPFVLELVAARNRLRDHYNGVLLQAGQGLSMEFTLDGNLVGDLGECLAAQYFGVRLLPREAIDGYAPDGRTVQVKATGVGNGPAFRNTTLRADHLLFFSIDISHGLAECVYNGPEAPLIASLPPGWTGQRLVSMTRVRALARLVAPHEALPVVGGTGSILGAVA